MKTNPKATLKKTAVLMLAIFIVSWGCRNRQADAGNNGGSNSESETMKTPEMDIFAAALMGNLEEIRLHIKAGSDLNQKDDYGSTPLGIASTFGRTDVALELIGAGADLNLQSKDGSTPLHTASFFCRTKIVQALLARGADKNIRNNYGSTPFESVAVPFDAVKPIYDQISKELGPLGLKLDYWQIEETRPLIAEMLK